MSKTIKSITLISIFLIIFGSLEISSMSPETTSQLLLKKIKTRRDDNWARSSFFDTRFLSSGQKTTQELVQRGYEPVQFNSADQNNYTLEGMYLDAPNSPFTVITVNGFVPGLWNGNSTMEHFFNDDSLSDPKNKISMLFFNGRGRGKSAGPYYRSFCRYGVDEYQDLLGAINFVHSNNPAQPIIIIGVCAGAYHALRLACTLGEKKETGLHAIKAIIADSSITSAKTASEHIFHDHLGKKFLKATMRAHQTKDEDTAKRTLRYRVGHTALMGLVSSVTGILRLMGYPHWRTMNINSRTQHIEIPVLFMHSEKDGGVPIEFAHEMAQDTPNHVFKTFKRSEHATLFLKEKYRYNNEIMSFLAKVFEKI